jgi:hypothetical protein
MPMTMQQMRLRQALPWASFSLQPWMTPVAGLSALQSSA